jgi:hypothetical protein
MQLKIKDKEMTLRETLNIILEGTRACFKNDKEMLEVFFDDYSDNDELLEALIYASNINDIKLTDNSLVVLCNELIRYAKFLKCDIDFLKFEKSTFKIEYSFENARIILNDNRKYEYMNYDVEDLTKDNNELIKIVIDYYVYLINEDLINDTLF